MKSRETLMSKITTVACGGGGEASLHTEEEKGKQKSKCLVQSPNVYFMDVKCPGGYKNITVVSHAQMEVLCVDCSPDFFQLRGRKQGWQKDAPSGSITTENAWLKMTASHPNKHILNK